MGLFGKSNRSNRPAPDTIEVVIGPRASLQGILRCDASVRIDGVVESGAIETLGNVIIMADARVECDIRAKTVSIHGIYRGNLFADRAEFLDGCSVAGAIHVKSVYIDDNASMTGELHMHETRQDAIPDIQSPPVSPVIPVVSSDSSRPIRASSSR